MKFRFCSLLGFSDVFNKKSGGRQSLDCRQTSALPEGTCREFSLAEIKAVTNNFHQDLIIGHGAFGPVYRGAVNDGTVLVAVKLRSTQEVEEFRTEIQLLCQLHHPNLVSLIGFCHEKTKMILVFEYASRGSVRNHLYGEDCVSLLAWNHRLQICIDAARGLHYLHTGAKRAVIHRKVNTSNILLDDEWSCKLSDFGLSKIGPLSMSKASINIKESRIVGTRGYMAPEYAIHGELTEKSDVYSFGILLFEVLCGRRVFDETLPKNKKYIIDWVRELGREGIMSHVVDPYLKGRIAPESFKKYLEIAFSCVHNEGNKRPAMGEVEVTLELALELQMKADAEIKGEYKLYEEASYCTYFDLCSDSYGFGE